ncbi:MAG: phosphoesterase PA-phosphatase related protein [Myxococcales bacterium]|nr:phosphoesterase PA-phosphatase related protein [Myxococcales bacterium]
MRSLVVTLILLSAAVARADEPTVPTPAPAKTSPPQQLGSQISVAPPIDRWYRGRYGKNRLIHVSITAAGALIYLASETFFKADFAAVTCRWCEPDAFDHSVRDALVWSNPSRAALLSNLTGYVIAPLFTAGVMLYDLSTTDPATSRVIDDVTPVLETVVLSQLLTQAVKFAGGRARPFVHFGLPGAPGVDDNLSFFSGHTALTFGLATSAGIIAHRRHYKLEPVIWGVGMTLAATTGYLRIAADKHYLTDVLVGAVVGVGSGLAVPLLMRRPEENLTVVPTGNGLALVGSF